MSERKYYCVGRSSGQVAVVDRGETVGAYELAAQILFGENFDVAAIVVEEDGEWVCNSWYQIMFDSGERINFMPFSSEKAIEVAKAYQKSIDDAPEIEWV